MILVFSVLISNYIYLFIYFTTYSKQCTVHVHVVCIMQIKKRSSVSTNWLTTMTVNYSMPVIFMRTKVKRERADFSIVCHLALSPPLKPSSSSAGGDQLLPGLFSQWCVFSFWHRSPHSLWLRAVFHLAKAFSKHTGRATSAAHYMQEQALTGMNKNW